LLQEGLDLEDATVPDAQSDPNGTEKVLHVGVPLGFTSMGHDRLWWFAARQLSGDEPAEADVYSFY
jgi:hypothetical protein